MKGKGFSEAKGTAVEAYVATIIRICFAIVPHHMRVVTVYVCRFSEKHG